MKDKDFKSVVPKSKQSKGAKSVNTNFKKELSKNKVKGIKIENEIVGGLADGCSIEDIANKHNVSEITITQQLNKGVKVEMEHTDDKNKAREIAMDHLMEDPNYYDKLETVEEDYAGSYSGPLFRESYTLKVKDLFNKGNRTTIKKSRLEESVKKQIKEVGGKDIHKEKWKSCFEKVKKQGKSEESAAAICTKSIGYEGSIKKKHRKKETLNEVSMEQLSTKIKNKVKTEFKTKKNVVIKLKNNVERAISDVSTGNIKKDEEAQKNLKNVFLDVAKLVGQSPAALVPGGMITLIAIRKLLPTVNNALKLSVEEMSDKKVIEKPKSDEKKDVKPPKSDKPKKKVKKETTTHSGVWGAGGPPVGKLLGSKGKKTSSGKKPIYTGGTIVQNLNNSSVLTKEQNDVKFVEGGKYVKIKNKCAKYRNQKWCSQGNIDKPLELSDNMFNNIQEVAKQTGLSEKQIIETILKSI
jgi:hypothetical protein